MTYTEIYNQVATNAAVWGVLFLIACALWVIAFELMKRKR